MYYVFQRVMSCFLFVIVDIRRNGDEERTNKTNQFVFEGMNFLVRRIMYGL